VYQTYEVQTFGEVKTGIRYHMDHRHRHRHGHRCRKSLSNIRVTDRQGHIYKCGDTISIKDTVTDTNTGLGRVYQSYEVQTVRDINTSV
jgi:hypothetical protein